MSLQASSRDPVDRQIPVVYDNLLLRVDDYAITRRLVAAHELWTDHVQSELNMCTFKCCKGMSCPLSRDIAVHMSAKQVRKAATLLEQTAQSFTVEN
ncbi:hypothetical protein BMW22_36065 (plasmid) [Rhizobium leguminosarum]|uniref:Uncharacterized protein n=1 Tax=Rhizobium leguminosarum TaxID=384 RepID=A0A1B1CP90_RHILE|nr:hypothetical protein BA011_36150 [Rhizobium leguminosarum]API56820.1 hypothetical protein BMW22_36065 [Rhizobium leguminosarum]